MQRFYRVLTVTGILSAFALSALLPVAYAGTAGRRNTAIVLTGAAVYSAVTKKKTATIVTGLGAAQAWKSYEDSRKRDSRNRNRGHRYSYKHRPRGHAYGYYRHHQGRGHR